MANDPNPSYAGNDRRPLSLEEQAEELRAELKLGALTEPDERAEAQRQLEALERQGPPEPEGEALTPAELLDQVKAAAVRGDPALYRKEQSYLQSIEDFTDFTPPAQPNDKLQDIFWDRATNETEAAARLIETYSNFTAAKDTEQQSLAELRNAASDDTPEEQLRPLINRHLQALYTANDVGADLYRAQKDYKDFRDVPHPSSSAPQNLRQVADAIVNQRDAEYSATLLDDDKITLEERDDAEVYLGQTTRILNERLALYQAAQNAAPAPQSDQNPAATNPEISRDETESDDATVLLDKLKEVATNGDPTLWQTERAYLAATGETDLPDYPADVRPAPTSPPANETEALQALKNAHKSVLTAQTNEQDRYDALKTAIANNSPESELHTAIASHFEAHNILDDRALDLYAAEDAYEPFRDSEPNPGEHLRALWAVVQAYETHESASHALAASVALNDEPNQIAVREQALAAAKQTLESRILAYQPFEAKSSIAQNNPDPASISPAGIVSTPQHADPEANPASSLSEPQIKNITDQLAARRADIQGKDPELAKEIWALDGAISYDPNAHQNSDVQTRIAYAVEDTEKLTGRLNLPGDVRAETTRLAANPPGLQNKELQSLLAQTPTINDPALVKVLRDKAKDIVSSAAQGEANDAKTRETVYDLGFRVATAPRVSQEPSALKSTPAERAPTGTNSNPSTPNPGGDRNTPQTPNPSPEASSPGQRARREIAAFDPDAGNNPSPTTTATAATARRTSSAESNRAAGQPPTDQNQGKPASQEQTPKGNPLPAQEETIEGTPVTIEYEKRGVAVRPLLGGPFQNLFRNIDDATKSQFPQTGRKFTDPQQAAPNNTKKPFSIAGRLDQHIAAKQTPTSQNTSLQDAHDAAKLAIEQIAALRANEAGALINKINDAAATTKGGIKEVLSEMKTGGAYEDLRTEFNHLYNENEAFRSTYDRAATALSDYGAKRVAVDQTIHKQPQDPLTGKIKQLDAQIAHATEGVPGTTDSQSITEKLAEAARKIVEEILERLRRTFDRSHEATPTASPSPAP